MKLIFILIQIGLFSCNSSTFSGTSVSKNKKPPSHAYEEVVVSDQNTEVDENKDLTIETEDSITDPETGEKICFEPPLPLPKELVAPVLLYSWDAGYGSSFFSSITPLVAKVYNEKPSIVTSANNTYPGSFTGYTFSISGVDGTTQWRSQDRVDTMATPAIGDIDSDGNMEVVTLNSDYKAIAIDGKTGATKWTSEESFSSNVWQILVADVDSDGKPEVIVDNKILRGKDGGFKFQLSSEASFSYFVGELDSSGKTKIISDKGIHHGQDGSIICEFSKPIYKSAVGRFLESNGFLTIIGNTTMAISVSTVAAFRGDDCSKIFETDIPSGSGGPFNLADFDGDNELEFGVAAEDVYVLFETDGSVKWTMPVIEHNTVTGSTAFDLNGDGSTEIIYADEQHIYVLDGKTGSTIYEGPSSSGTTYENPIIADVDSDGHANIIAATYGSSPYGIRVYKDPDNAWINTRQIWNQHAYSVTNIGGQGELAGYDPKNIWKKRIKSEHLLGFRNNLPMRPTKECE